MKHLESALKQENQWWKYLLVLLIGFLGGQIIGAIPLVVAMGIGAARNGGNIVTPDNPMDLSAYGIDPNLGLVLMVFPFLVMLFISILLIKAFHKRSFREVINGGGVFRWRRFWKGFLVWGVFAVILLVASLLFDRENYELNFQLSKFIPLVIISLLLIPFQAGTEEFFFRGYLAQGVGSWTKKRWLAVLLPSVFFALLHCMNPEIKEFGFWTMIPSYILFGIVFGVISILDDGIELAIGVHSVNNILSSIFVTSKSSVLQTPAMFIQKEVDPSGEFWGLLAVSIVFILVVSYKSSWNYQILFSGIQQKKEEHPEED
ncbi:CPBP family intramembrane metalloprotease [Maribellus comscasis]|uniref:CPBP family intramembrane metalloprotease n=1 Tax=Maribellus comscasis TaxID=2681766 RepID=A0A6I6K1R0_9BACT|nr:CPBP family intramembrane glutamic endopeptidase [Maribellus comscasis]QGY47340.1 CPBP family intramembrane metalloprotease [Maribellus comscasis]